MTPSWRSATVALGALIALAGCGAGGPSPSATLVGGATATAAPAGATGGAPSLGSATGTASTVTVPAVPSVPPPAPSQPGPGAGAPGQTTTLPLDGRRVAFATPSGHTVCHLGRVTDAMEETVSCMVDQPTWAPPPPTPARCEGRMYGHVIEIQQAQARYGCSTQEQFSLSIYRPNDQLFRFDWLIPGVDALVSMPFSGGQQVATLAYGRTIRYGDHQCTSTTSGARCVNVVTGHGFVIATNRNDLF